MYADESYSYVQKDEMDRKVLETEGHVSPALSSLFREVIVCLVICETMCERNDFSLLEMTVQYYGLFSNFILPVVMHVHTHKWEGEKKIRKASLVSALFKCSNSSFSSPTCSHLLLISTDVSLLYFYCDLQYTTKIIIV